MKVRQILIVAAAAVASTSFASEMYHPSNAAEGVTLYPQHISGNLTRAQVNTAVMGAQRDGSLTWIGRDYPASNTMVPAPSLSKSREQVLGELSAWQRNPVTADGVREVRGELGWVNARQVP